MSLDIITTTINQPVELTWDFENTLRVTLRTYEVFYNSVNGSVFEDINGDEFYALLVDTKIVPRVSSETVNPKQSMFYVITAENFFNQTLTKEIKIDILDQPYITNLSNNQGQPGDTLSIFGNNFDTNILNLQVKFRGLNNTQVNANIISNTNNEIQVTVPLNILTGPIQVNSDSFELFTEEFTVNKIDDTISTITNLPSLYNDHIEGGSFSDENYIFTLSGGNNFLEIYDPVTNIINSAESAALYRSGFPIVEK